MKSTTDFPASDDAACSRCLESRKLADDALATLRAIKEKYGLGDRHVMREKSREIARLREALEAADECLALIEDVGHGAHMDNVTKALCPENASAQTRPPKNTNQ
jgi:hypothetical protein